MPNRSSRLNGRHLKKTLSHSPLCYPLTRLCHVKPVGLNNLPLRTHWMKYLQNSMKFVGYILTILVLFPFYVCGRTRTDTIYTDTRDRIILTYEVSVTANQATITFDGVKKKLGYANEKYKDDLPKVVVMFFDRVGNYGHASINGMVPETITIPSDVGYQRSQDGFFMLTTEQAGPKLSFSVKADTEITIPMYLAYKPKKGKYNLFAKSRGLRIPLGRQKESVRTAPTMQTVQHTFTSTSEMEPDNTVTTKVLESIKLAKNLISETTEIPFSENLLDEIRFLREKRREVTDEDLVSRITEVMDEFEEKRQWLEEKQAAEQEARQQEDELRAKAEAARNDSIDTAQRMDAEQKREKRNLWMIIGGAIFAVLAFAGNQVLQSVRNRKNQMRMLDMQQNIANRAEAEAKRRARNAIRSQKNRLVNEAKQKTENAIRKTINVNGKSKKPSI